MAADTTISPPRAPDARFLVSHPAHFVALGFGVGLVRFAPGTFGTLLGLAISVALAFVMPPLFIAFLAIPLFFLGVWACDITGRDLGVEDHGSMVWDEVVAFLPLGAVAAAWVPVYAMANREWPVAGFAQVAAAFLLFRLFDIWKPYPIRLLEANIKGGLGVMIDDLAAGFYAYVAFGLFVWVMHRGLGFA